MNKGGMGVGSSSIMLIFSVLCLAVFSLISLSVAGNDKALVDTEAKLITGYYKADELAERILTTLIASGGTLPDEVLGVKIDYEKTEDSSQEIATYQCPISDIKELVVKAAVHKDSTAFDIIMWKMVNTDDWVIDDSMPVWSGDGDDFGFLDLG